MRFPKNGLYAITQTNGKTGETVIEEVNAAIRGGASIIQYRDKRADDKLRLNLAKELLSCCQQHKVSLIINDDTELALLIGADGVHLGKEDDDIVSVRRKLGNKAIIGLSCYNDLKLAKQAEANGADYVAFGRFFPSSSKPHASPASIETLQLAKKQITIPIVAIGGILPENGGQLLNAGADVLAVIGGLFDHQPEQSAKAYMKLFESYN